MFFSLDSKTMTRNYTVMGSSFVTIFFDPSYLIDLLHHEH